MDSYIVEVTSPTNTEGQPSWLLQSAYSLESDIALSIVGSTAQLDTPSDVLTMMANQTFKRRVYLVALTGSAPADAPLGELGLPTVAADDGSWPRGDILAEFWGDAPLNENTDVVEGEFVMAPGALDAGAAILAATEAAAAALGRHIVLSWTWHKGGADVGDVAELNSPTGEGAIPADDDASLHVDHGYRLTSIERQSSLKLPVSEEILRAFEERGSGALGQYTIEVTEGPLAEADVDAMASLLSRLDADAPHEGVDVEVGVWDADRVAEWEASSRSETRTRILTLARHTDGTVVGYSELRVPLAGEPTAAFQIGTLVLPEHRGHRLAWLLKAAGLRHLQATHPERTHVDTWNSFDNEAMLAINVDLGFDVVGTYGCWRKDVN